MNKKNPKKSQKSHIIFIFFYLIFSPARTFANHQTIINIPSSEVLPAGHMIIKDSNRFRPLEPDGFAQTTPSFTLGIGSGTEVAAGVETRINENYDVRARGVFSAKKVFNLSNSTRLTVGGNIRPYFTQSTHPDTFLYTHISQRIKKTKTSITFGGYASGQEHLPNQSGVIVGLDQAIIKNKLRFAMDWLSGDNSHGRLGLGIKYRPVPTVSVTTSVLLPNKELENIVFGVSISKFIELDDENPIKRRLINGKSKTKEKV